MANCAQVVGGVSLYLANSTALYRSARGPVSSGTAQTLAPPPVLTSFHTQAGKSDLYLFAPYMARLATLLVISNEGISSYSTSATSGMPVPDLMASASFTYSALPPPTSSNVTWMLGWVLLNSATNRFWPGDQSQKTS